MNLRPFDGLRVLAYPLHCPRCDSRDLTGGELRPDLDDPPRTLVKPVQCGRCGCYWHQHYRLVDATEAFG